MIEAEVGKMQGICLTSGLRTKEAPAGRSPKPGAPGAGLFVSPPGQATSWHQSKYFPKLSIQCRDRTFRLSKVKPPSRLFLLRAVRAGLVSYDGQLTCQSLHLGGVIELGQPLQRSFCHHKFCHGHCHVDVSFQPSAFAP